MSLREIIASITIEQPTAITPSPTATKKTPTKSLVPTPTKTCIAAAPKESELKKTKSTLPKVTKVAETLQTSLNKSQKKKQPVGAPLGSLKERFSSGIIEEVNIFSMCNNKGSIPCQTSLVLLFQENFPFFYLFYLAIEHLFFIMFACLSVNHFVCM